MTPFAIVADLRTGSTLLSSSLDQHPEVRCLGELLHPRDFADNRPAGTPNPRALDGRALVRRALAPAQGLAAAGFRAMVFLPLPSQPAWANAWEALARTEGLRVIYLTRGDRLAQYASLAIATRLGVWHPAGEPPVPAERRPRLRIEPHELAAWTRERERLYELRRAQLGRKPALELRYEQLAEDWPEAIGRVQAFLGVTPLPLAPAKHKQEVRPLAEVIENYEEVRAGWERHVA